MLSQSTSEGKHTGKYTPLQHLVRPQKCVSSQRPQIFTNVDKVYQLQFLHSFIDGLNHTELLVTYSKREVKVTNPKKPPDS